MHNPPQITFVHICQRNPRWCMLHECVDHVRYYLLPNLLNYYDFYRSRESRLFFDDLREKKKTNFISTLERKRWWCDQTWRLKSITSILKIKLRESLIFFVTITAATAANAVITNKFFKSKCMSCVCVWVCMRAFVWPYWIEERAPGNVHL